jgi:hypothetical protein
MLRREGQFHHYEPPYMPGELLTLPNTMAPVGIEKIGTGKVVVWRGFAYGSDSVSAPVGTEFRPTEGPVNYVFTLREDGWLDYRYSPQRG